MNWLARLLLRALASLFRRRPPAVLPPTPTPAPPPIVIPAPAPHFLNTLRAATLTPLSRTDYEAAARGLGCEWQALAAVAEVESGRPGAFDDDARPIILFERHLFSAKTLRRYDVTHAHLSSKHGGNYPLTQVLRWAQLSEAFALDEAAALESVSWGRFQTLGQNYHDLGLANARAYVAKLARSERDQLEAFEAYVVMNGLVGALREKNWAAFARGYNGRNYAANRYDTRMARAYARICSVGVLV